MACFSHFNVVCVKITTYFLPLNNKQLKVSVKWKYAQKTYLYSSKKYIDTV